MNDVDGDGVGQVEADGAFTAIVDVKLKVIVTQAVNLWRATVAAHGVTTQGFDLDDGGAHIGEDCYSAWRRHPVVDFNNGNIVQR